MSISTTARRVIAGTLGLVAVLGLSGAPAEAAAPSPSTSTNAGLFGAGDPTYTGVYRQSLAILALAATGATIPTESITWLLGQQCSDGGFQGYTTAPTACTAPDSTNYAGEDTNNTGMALQALSALGQQAAAQKAADWLVAHQNTDHGFAYYPDQATNSTPPDSDANSTAIALMGLNAFNAYAASIPVAGYPAPVTSASAFLATLQLVPCPIAPAEWPANTTDGSFSYTANGPGAASNNYATVQASFALTGHLLTDGPLAAGTTNEIPVTCTGGTPDTYDPAKVSASYINVWVGTPLTTPTFGSGLTDEPAWAALAMSASGLALPLVGDQPSISIALTAADAAVSNGSTDPGDISMDILARHIQPGGATDTAIPGLVSRLLATLAPVASSSPAVSGTVAVGQTVACNPGVWTKSPSGFTYTWYRGANTVVARTYALRLTPALVSQSIRCTVTATNTFGSTTASSAARKVAVGTLTNTGLPTIVGSARVGGYLAATSGSWSQLPTNAKYVWKRGNTVVGTGIGYRVKQADRGKKLTVVVTVTRPGYTGTASSKPRTVR